METLGKHFRSLTKPAFERHGFARAELLSSWTAVVGAEVAAICRPEKLQWPRAQDKARKEGGTLVLRAEPGRSLDVQYATPRLIDRVNRYFGYEAVTDVKVKQGTTMTKMKSPRTLASQPAPPMSIDGIHDEALRTALSRLGQNIKATTVHPQPK